MRQGAIDLRIADLGQALARRRSGMERGQRLLGVAPVLLDVQGRKRLDRGALRVVEFAAHHQVISQWSGLIPCARMERREELRLVDQSSLKGQKSKEQMTVGVTSHRRASQGRRENERDHSPVPAIGVRPESHCISLVS